LSRPAACVAPTCLCAHRPRRSFKRRSRGADMTVRVTHTDIQSAPMQAKVGLDQQTLTDA